jgi:hypothetical protein
MGAVTEPLLKLFDLALVAGEKTTLRMAHTLVNPEV